MFEWLCRAAEKGMITSPLEMPRVTGSKLLIRETHERHDSVFRSIHRIRRDPLFGLMFRARAVARDGAVCDLFTDAVGR